jgi:hypothetical protein
VGDPFLPALEERVDPGGPSLESGDMGSTLEKEGQKVDDAAVPVHIWENHFRETLPPHFPPLCDDWREKLGAYRSLGLRWWRRQVTQSFWRYVRDRVPNISAGRRPGYVRFQPGRYIWLTHGCSGYQKEWRALHSHPLVTRDWDPARECVEKAAKSDWWEWSGGSRPFFWRWPPRYRGWARDCQPHYQTKVFPRFTQPQQAPRTEEDRIKCWRKLFKVRERRYIDTGPVLGLMHMFYVLKGGDDIRMVYNGAASGINECIFAPTLGYPSSRTWSEVCNRDIFNRTRT